MARKLANFVSGSGFRLIFNFTPFLFIVKSSAGQVNIKHFTGCKENPVDAESAIPSRSFMARKLANIVSGSGLRLIFNFIPFLFCFIFCGTGQYKTT
jgi:hypothetical protein